MITNPQQRWFKISEVQINALRQGWTHTSIKDEKGILQTVSEDQMIDCGCASHSFQNPYARVIGIHCPLCNWHQVVPIDEWYFQSTEGHGHTCGSDKCPSHTYMVLDNYQSDDIDEWCKLHEEVLKDIRTEAYRSGYHDGEYVGKNEVLERLKEWCNEQSKEAYSQHEPTFNVVGATYATMAIKCEQFRRGD